MELTKKIIFDLNNEIYTRIDAKQNDAYSRYIEFTLTNGGVPVDLTAHTVKIFAVKADNTLIFNNVQIADATNGKVLVRLTSQALAVVGELDCELVIYDGDNSVLSSKVFTINVLASIRNDSAVESTNEFTALTEGITKLNGWDQQFQQKYDGLNAQYAQQLTSNTNKLGNLSDNGIAELSLAEAIKNDRDSLADIAANASLYSTKQTMALAKLIDKNINNYPIVGVCLGDSLTAGLQEGGVNPYPTILQNILNEYTGNQATVINRGHGGDTTKLSYERWTTNPNADFHIIMLGTNDKYFGLTIEESVNYYWLIIKRILDWGSAVVLLTPPRKQGYSTDIMAFNTIVKRLGEMLNIPVFDTAEMLEGYNMNDIYVSDTVHYNDIGYYYLASKIATLFIGSSIIKNNFFKIKSGKHISLESWRGYMRVNGIADLQSKISTTTNSPFGSGHTTNEGIQINLDQNQQLNIAFYAEEDDLVLIPIFDITGQAQCSIETNYRSAQPKQVTALSDKKSLFSDVAIPSKNLIFTKGTVQNTYSDTPYYIRLTSRGLNNVYIKNTGDAGTTLRFMGFYVMGYDTFNSKQRIETVNSSIPIIKSGTLTTSATTGSVTFTTPFPTACSSVVAICEEYQAVAHKVSYYNKTATGFNWTVDTSGVKFNWVATGN